MFVFHTNYALDLFADDGEIPHVLEGREGGIQVPEVLPWEDLRRLGEATVAYGFEPPAERRALLRNYVIDSKELTTSDVLGTQVRREIAENLL